VQGKAHRAVAPPACERPSAVGKDVTCGYPPRAQYVSRRVSRRHVSAGQRQMVPRPPEPRAQVRILPGALVICTNSNALTTLTQPKPRHLNCGDPACAGPYGQNAVSPRKGVRHHERAEDLHTGGAGRRAVL
jgi:hypothetical protein